MQPICISEAGKIFLYCLGYISKHKIARIVPIYLHFSKINAIVDLCLTTRIMLLG